MRNDKNHVGRPTNEELRNKKRKKYTKLGLFLIPVLLITLVLVNFNTKKIVGNVVIENNSFENLYDNKKVKFKQVFSDVLPNKTVTMQSFKFSKDKKTLYITQHDSDSKSTLAILTKNDNKEWKYNSGKALYYFGHVANIDIEYKKNGKNYLWIACGVDSKNKKLLDKSRMICRKNAEALKKSKKYGKSKKGTYGTFGTFIINNKDLKISSSSFENYQIAVDNASNKVIVKKGGRAKSCYYIYNKSKFLSKNYTKEKSFCVDNNKTNSNVSWQGFAFNNNYLYVLEGNSGKENVYLSIYNTENIDNNESFPKKDETKVKNYENDKYLYRKIIINKDSKFNGETIKYQKWEPEGVQVLDDELLIGFTVIVKNDNKKCKDGNNDYCKRQIIYNASIEN